MANTFTVVPLEDGKRNYIVKLTGVLDTSDQAMTPMVAPSDCAYFIPSKFRIDHIDFAISDGLEVQLWWDGTPDELIVPLYGRAKFNYNDLGGIQNNAFQATGKINFKTTGYAGGILVYSVMLWLVKQGMQPGSPS